MTFLLRICIWISGRASNDTDTDRENNIRHLSPATSFQFPFHQDVPDGNRLTQDLTFQMSIIVCSFEGLSLHLCSRIVCRV
jgi:hypothetical protein